MRRYCLIAVTTLITGAVMLTSGVTNSRGRSVVPITVTPNALTFEATADGSAPSQQQLTITALRQTTVSVTAVTEEGDWLSVSPSGSFKTDQTIAVSVNPSRLAARAHSGEIRFATLGAILKVPVTLNISPASGTALKISPSALAFASTQGNPAPASQTVLVSAPTSTNFTGSVSTQDGAAWLSVNPSGDLTTNRTLAVSVDSSKVSIGSYNGAVTATSDTGAVSVAVTFTLSPVPGGGGGTTTGYKLIGWNDLGMHCQDGKDFSIFSVLPPFNTIHAHLIDASGKLVKSDAGYTVTYEAVADPLTGTLNTTSVGKTNFWQYAAALGYGTMASDLGLKGFAMPGSQNAPQAMSFSTADNTWTAVGIPIMPYADAPAAPYPVNYFPMMRLVARNSSGTLLAGTNIVLPVSDEMTCSVCHASNMGTGAAMPANGWVNHPDPAKDIKLNILRKHDERFAATALFQTAATQVGYSTAGLEATIATKPILCATCHASNALGLAGISGVESLTTAVHILHAAAVDPETNQTLDAATSRQACYRCHPGPNTRCLRGAMGSLQATAGVNAIECQSCHGPMSTVGNSTRNGWLEEPSCQGCHTGTATHNSGQIAFTSVFSSGTAVRIPADLTFATNSNTPAPGLSLFRFSSGHGGLQCESCHGSTHAEYASTVLNDNVQPTNLQGHASMLAECTACHTSTPNTVTGGPHGLHPIGASWVNAHHDVAERQGATQCQPCHGSDYRGTILSKMQADRSMANRFFARGTMIGCYNCHNGPNGGD